MQLTRVGMLASVLLNISTVLFCMKDKHDSADTIKMQIYQGPPPRKSKLSKNSDYFSKKLLTLVKSSYESDDPTKNSLMLNANILTYTPLAQELIRAKEKGVNVTVLLAQKSLQYGNNNLKALYKQFPAYVYSTKKGDDTEVSENHAKLFLYDIDGAQGYSIGSSNTSFYGLFHNSELNKLVHNDSENYKKIMNDLEKIKSKSLAYDEYLKKEEKNSSPLKLGLSPLKQTPEKKVSVYTTLDKKLIALILNRLDPKKFNAGDEIWLSTYTFNSEKITKILCELIKMGVKVHLYIDKNPLTTKDGIDQITTLLLAEKVVNRADVYIYGIGSEADYIHHAKFLLINRKGDDKENRSKKQITITSTQNFLESRGFDAISLDQTQQSFDDMKKTIKSYNDDKNFVKVDKETIKTFIKQIASKKDAKRKLDFDVDSQKNKKTKN